MAIIVFGICWGLGWGFFLGRRYERTSQEIDQRIWELDHPNEKIIRISQSKHWRKG